MLLEKSYGSGKNSLSKDEILWSLAEFKNAVKKYPFIVFQFGSTHISYTSPLFNNNTTRLYVNVDNPGGTTLVVKIAEYGDNNIKITEQHTFPYIRCTSLRILGVKITVL